MFYQMLLFLVQAGYIDALSAVHMVSNLGLQYGMIARAINAQNNEVVNVFAPIQSLGTAGQFIAKASSSQLRAQRAILIGTHLGGSFFNVVCGNQSINT